MYTESFYLLIDLDGLRNDVFQEALALGNIPNLTWLLKGLADANSLNLPLVSTAPSITFSAQASIFTGQDPRDHGVPGNQFFDRFGTFTGGQPRFYTFDVGDQLGFLDAIRVFTSGLASSVLQAETIYQDLQKKGFRSVVAGNMYAAGAEWLRPTLIDLARLTKMPEPLELTPSDYDAKLIDTTIRYLKRRGLPDLLTIYLKGLDEYSHRNGPDQQLDYLTRQIDPLFGTLRKALLEIDPKIDGRTTTLLFSDHGQTAITPDDIHSIRLAFPFEKEMEPLFSELGLDVHDYPGEGPDCSAVVAMNGGMAFVYLRNRQGAWQEKPVFARDVLPIGEAFWQASNSGRYAPELKGAISAVLVKNTEKDGWEGAYQALEPDGKLVSLEDWFSDTPLDAALDPAARIRGMNSGLTGDLVLVSDPSDGYYFSPPLLGSHGGLTAHESEAFLAASWPDAETEKKKRILDQVEAICQRENRSPSLVDIKLVLDELMSSSRD